MEKTVSVVRDIDAWQVITNSDLTEGRGRAVLLDLCELKATAKRIAKCKGVMGSDASIHKVTLYRIDGSLYGPVHLNYGTEEDKRAQAKLETHEAAVERAKELGLTDKEIALIKGGA